MKKYGKLKKEEIKKQFDAMVESAKKEVDKGKNGANYAFAIGNEAVAMVQENIEYFDYINLEAKKHIKEVIEYAAQKKS